MCERFDRLAGVNFGDVPTWIGSGVALIVGIVGIVYGVLGYRQASKSNRIAGEARDKAAEANQIAEAANLLSAEANTLAARTAAAQEEDWFVDWTAQWDSKSSAMVLVNTGSHEAGDVAVTFSADEIHGTFSGNSSVPAGEFLVVPAEEVMVKRGLHDAERAASAAAMRSAGIGYVGARYKATLKVTVRWRTGLGFPASRELELAVN